MEANHLTLTTEIMEELKMNEYSDGLGNNWTIMKMKL